MGLKIDINDDKDYAVQTTITGNTIFSLPQETINRSLVDFMLMIMNEEGPKPMLNKKPAKKTRNAADQFYNEHQEEYEKWSPSTSNPIDYVNAHNNASPKMIDELQKRRSTAQRSRQSTNKNSIIFDPNCPQCVKLKKQQEDQLRRRKEKEDEKRRRQQNRNKASKKKLDKVNKRKGPPKKTRRYLSRSRASKQSTACSNKCFQCYLNAKKQNAAKFKSIIDLSSQQGGTPAPPPTPATSLLRLRSKEGNYSKSTTGVTPVPELSKSNLDLVNPDRDPGPSVSSYNSFLSMEHEPMVD